ARRRVSVGRGGGAPLTTSSPLNPPDSTHRLAFGTRPSRRAALLGTLNLGDPNSSNAYDHPLYFGRTSDPLFTLHCTGASCNFEGKQIHIPVDWASKLVVPAP